MKKIVNQVGKQDYIEVLCWYFRGDSVSKVLLGAQTY